MEKQYKNKIYRIIFVVSLLIFCMSLIFTIAGLVKGNYINDFRNYTSFKDLENYMVEDTLFVTDLRDYTHDGSSFGSLIIEGVLLSDKSKKVISQSNNEPLFYIGREDYLVSDGEIANLNKLLVFRSKLTNDIFLKNANKSYYKNQMFSIASGIFFKVALYVLLLIYLSFYINKKIKS